MDTNPRWNMMNAACPTRQVLDRIADKWTMLVIVALEQGTLRFSELRRSRPCPPAEALRTPPGRSNTSARDGEGPPGAFIATG